VASISARTPAATTDDLPSTAYAVLGLLSGDHELSGYDLKKWADNSLHFFYWSPSLSHIYTELRRLDRLGFVSQRVEPRGELRSRRLYRITTLGATTLEAWVRDSPVEATVLKHSVALRIWLGHLVGIDSVRLLIAEHVAATERLILDIRTAYEHAPKDAPNHFSAEVVAWADELHTAELAAFAHLLERLDTPSGAAAAPSGIAKRTTSAS
jgi:DNA-binding PadR family transcriptional regulator